MSGLNRYSWWVPGTPRTDPNARVCRWRPVNGVRAVRITNGWYRKAPITGIFELLYARDGENPIQVQPSGKRIVQVICAWQGYMPSQSYARIDVTSPASTVKLLDDFSGDVVDNIGHPSDPLSLDDDGSLFPDEVARAEKFWEGATRRVTVNAYERDPAARRACIAHYGAACTVCHFDFAARYGDLGIGFIHVHHTRPLSKVRAAYAVNPKRDLIPVCPNCHAMLHRASPTLTVRELQKRVCHAV